MRRRRFLLLVLFAASVVAAPSADARGRRNGFRVLAFYTAKEDPAHISFVHEANRWFPRAARTNGFTYEATNDWSRLNARELAGVDVVLFLDTRPEGSAERAAFEAYMRGGGAWMGFHFAAFALNDSAVKPDWPWYHDQFIGAGEYRSNTWRPTSAVLRVERRDHPATQRLPATFRSQPNEWYRWMGDLRHNPKIQVLLSIDPSSFPLGTGPKPEEIWHDGDYPVVWTNTDYRMLYVNMGHDDMDYGGTNASLSSTFGSPTQNRFLLDALRWLGSGPRSAARTSGAR